MTKEAALQAFYSRFLTAYQENAVPTGDDRPDYPYITYEVQTGSWDDIVALSASLWYRSMSWNAVNAKAREISAAIGRGGITLPCDNGSMHLWRGTPFDREGGDSDPMVKRKILNILATFNTED